MTQKIKLLEPFRPLMEKKWRYIIIHGGRYSGKSWHVAMCLLLRGQEECLRILCTREIQNTIKDSVHKILKDLISEYELDDYDVTNDSIVNRATGTEFLFKGLRANVSEIKSTEGVDICWVEEGQNITAASLDILLPTIRKEGSQIIVTFNRFLELDPVYVRFVINQPPNTVVINVNFDVMERNGLLTETMRIEIDHDRNDPELFAHVWLGQPMSQSEKAILSRTEVLEAMRRKVSRVGAKEVGVDVARYGDDSTVFYMRIGLATMAYRQYKKQSLTDTYDRLLEFVVEDRDLLIKIDDTGLGGGLTDMVSRARYRVMPVNFGAKASTELMETKYSNIISEAWFNFKAVLSTIELPYDPELLMELTSRQWKLDTKGRRVIESKDEYKKRGFKSPDKADAIILTYFHGSLGTYGEGVKRPEEPEEYTEGGPGPDDRYTWAGFGAMNENF